jgi:tetratricopeptide (TPR) repeat protein
MMGGDFIEVARIYSRRGDNLRAALALEMTGNRLAAVRAYREAKSYEKAAELLREEGMYKEAAEMYGISLSGKTMDRSTTGRFHSYGSLLEAAGQPEKAREVYKEIAASDPYYKDATERAGTLSMKEESPPVEAANYAHSEASQATTPKNLCSPRMEPRYAFRVWVQILKSLDAMAKQETFIDNLSPESIAIDSKNTVTFFEHVPKHFVYVAPEIIEGESSDQVSLIYSMGVILYEMLAGDLDSFGMKNPGGGKDDMPTWLDELAVRCIKRARAERYQSFDEIFSALRALRDRIS